jgi:hypothetical protein
MPIDKAMTEDQIEAIKNYCASRASLEREETLAFIAEHDLPWNTVEAFRVWVRNNGFWASGAATSKTVSPTLRGINKFAGGTDAMNLARILLEDKDKALAGAISSLSEEIESIKLEAEQQINVIKNSAEERIAERKATIEQLQNQLSGR